MSQTQYDFNSVMFARPGESFRTKKELITGAADIPVGGIIVPDGAGKFRAAVDADKVVSGAAALDAGWRILLEAFATAGGDATLITGKSGGVYEDKLVAVTGLTYDDLVMDKLQMNSIYVVKGTNALAVAGEGA